MVKKASAICYGEYSYAEDAEYFIELIGIYELSQFHAIIDDVYLCYHLRGRNTVAIEAPIGSESIPLEQALFYSNAFAYEHEVPTLIRPLHWKAKVVVEPAIKSWKGCRGTRVRWKADQWFESMQVIYEELASIKHGVHSVGYKYESLEELANIPFTNKYGSLSKEISLYAGALRKADPLSEYLNYYRIIESISGGKGIEWIDLKIKKIKSHDYGSIYLYGNPSQKRKSDLLKIYKKRALSSIDKLRTTKRRPTVGEHLYGVNRCGIAHGRDGVVELDFDDSTRNISEDTYIIKMLARMAIDESVKE